MNFAMPEFLTNMDRSDVIMIAFLIFVGLAILIWREGWLGLATETRIKAEIAKWESLLKIKLAKQAAAAPASVATGALMSAYKNRDALLIDIGAKNTPQAVKLDNVIIHDGTVPALEYASNAADGTVAVK